MAGRLARRVYASPRWRIVRGRVLDLADWRCSLCHGYANEVHHIRPIDEGGDPFALDNLRALCRGCHFGEHRKTKPDDRPTVRDRGGWRRLLASVTT